MNTGPFRAYIERTIKDDDALIAYLTDWTDIAAAWESVNSGHAIESSGVMLHNRLQWRVYRVPGHVRIDIHEQ